MFPGGLFVIRSELHPLLQPLDLIFARYENFASSTPLHTYSRRAMPPQSIGVSYRMILTPLFEHRIATFIDVFQPTVKSPKDLLMC